MLAPCAQSDVHMPLPRTTLCVLEPLQVIALCEQPRDPPLSHILVDTPGQIEIFTWSASGAIVSELLAGSFPTTVLFVVDTPRAAAPQTFMSNMLQAVSILYKTRLPLILVRIVRALPERS
jgi:hypothetical protein